MEEKRKKKKKKTGDSPHSYWINVRHGGGRRSHETKPYKENSKNRLSPGIAVIALTLVNFTDETFVITEDKLI